MITLKEHISKSNRDPSNSAEKYARELTVRMRHFREDIGEIGPLSEHELEAEYHKKQY